MEKNIQLILHSYLYAAYGGVFVILSLLWGWKIDRIPPDLPDIIGCFLVTLGVVIMMYYPRG
ncbi:hypothetical protein [Aphanothece hegewaldii]|uniref:hypothetical protein n=1 Tax=Aphanothece hegewaldii TaxID=1521625 RepID=UPI001FE27F3B|nr:hypothetical protein [Aphanothece hegewaldii]